MKKRLAGLTLAAFLAVAPGAALAGHEHFLVTPGTCVEDIAGGQTRISDPEHGGFHRFHDNVHVGIGGAGGPLNRDGVSRVIVDKTVGGNQDNFDDCEAALED